MTLSWFFLVSIGVHGTLALISYSPHPERHHATTEVRFEVEAITDSSDSAPTASAGRTGRDPRKHSPKRVFTRSEQPENVPAAAGEAAAPSAAGPGRSRTNEATADITTQAEAPASFQPEPAPRATFARIDEFGKETGQCGKYTGGTAGDAQAVVVDVPVPARRATYRSHPEPEYPETAWREGWEGTVVLEIVIASNGAPERVAVARSSGFAVLDRAAREAVKKWRFSPASVGGERVSSVERVPIVFKLNSPD